MRNPVSRKTISSRGKIGKCPGRCVGSVSKAVHIGIIILVKGWVPTIGKPGTGLAKSCISVIDDLHKIIINDRADPRPIGDIDSGQIGGSIKFGIREHNVEGFRTFNRTIIGHIHGDSSRCLPRGNGHQLITNGCKVASTC
ncbi:hypothetical protein V144x_31450 [Gimesia aquarii]|uniref:Uncharacterized protein n=1 Tax=Gimesia aquarii TaxID=2527964 RepID=A0A517VXD7_9PLAN|nr:hypothetical protein V144x_31450 [Gimesia aquarii]